MGNPIAPLSRPVPEPSPGPVLLPGGPPAKRPSARRVLQRTAEQLGRTVAAVVNRARRLPAKLGEAKARLVAIRDRAADTETAAGARTGNAEQPVGRLAARIGRFAEERPLHLIAGAASTAFLLGFALRVGRSNRARS